MTELPSHQHCLACGIFGDYTAETQFCPWCGGNLITEQTEENDDRVELLIPFPAIQCPTCGKMTLVRRTKQCVHCHIDLGDAARSQGNSVVKRRRQAFKVLLERLIAHIQESSLLQPTFTRQGQGLALSDYKTTIFMPSIEAIEEITATVRKALRTVTWDPQEDRTCVTNFQQIIGALEKSIPIINTLTEHLPPLEMRAIHRLVTRTIGQIIQGYVTMTRAIIALDIDEAFERQNEGQNLFIAGSCLVEHLPRIMNALSQQESPGWWMTGDTLDFAAIAWQGVDHTSKTINQAASQVRTLFAQIPGISHLSDADALHLFPAIILPLAITDAYLLQERTKLVHAILTEADRTVPDWIQDPTELVRQANEGVQIANEQMERLGFATNGPASRKMTMHLLTDVYRLLVEGTLRNLGSIIVIAKRVGEGKSNGSYTIGTARGVHAGEVLQELDSMGSVWSEDVRMLIRNASAHAGIQVLETGIQLTQRKIENEMLATEQTIVLSDAEFTEEFARLSETCQALQLSIMAWLGTHTSPPVIHAKETAPTTLKEKEAIIRMLAGLQGLLHVTITPNKTSLQIQATTAEGINAETPQILYLVPAIFQCWTDLESVTLSINTRDTITYTRAELPDQNPFNGELDPVGLGIMGRKWLGKLSGDAAIEADITFLIRPQIKMTKAALDSIHAQPISLDRMKEARTYLLTITNRLRSTTLPPPGTALATKVNAIVYDATRRLDRLIWAWRGDNPYEQQRQFRSCASLSNQLDTMERTADQEMTRLLLAKSHGIPENQQT